MARTRLRRVVSIALVFGVLLGALFAGAAVARGPSVSIKGNYLSGYSFKPRKITVRKGATVDWSWNSDAAHNVTFRSLGKHSATKAKGSYHLKFRHKGTFRYRCTVHGFTGKIVVK
ncbi:MAG: cupredoxin domain-containing protein [Solirubrobacterales bacterium]